MTTKKKPTSIHYTGVDSSGKMWIVSEQQRDAIRSSSRILGWLTTNKNTKKGN